MEKFELLSYQTEDGKWIPSVKIIRISEKMNFRMESSNSFHKNPCKNKLEADEYAKLRILEIY